MSRYFALVVGDNSERAAGYFAIEFDGSSGFSVPALRCIGPRLAPVLADSRPDHERFVGPLPFAAPAAPIRIRIPPPATAPVAIVADPFPPPKRRDDARASAPLLAGPRSSGHAVD